MTVNELADKWEKPSVIYLRDTKGNLIYKTTVGHIKTSIYQYWEVVSIRADELSVVFVIRNKEISK